MPKRNAFTLVELLVVISIIALLLSILMPALNKARASAQTVACASVLRQLLLATNMYAHDNQDYGVGIGQTHFYVYRDSNVWAGHRKVYDQMKKYVTNDDHFWRCPSDKVIWNDSKKVFAGYKVTSYAWARVGFDSWTGYLDTPVWKLSAVKRPSTSALFGDGCWELSVFWLPLWHSNGYNVGFVDGHVKHYRSNRIQGRVRKDW